MIRLFAAALIASVAASGSALGQAKPPKPIVGPWSQSKSTPLQLAEKVDSRLSGLRQVVGAYQVWMTLSGTGHSVGDMWIKDSKTFRIEYPEMHYRQTDKDRPLSKVFLISNGSTAQLDGGSFHKNQSPQRTLRLYTARSVADWVFGFPRYVAAGVHGEQALTNLVKEASKPDSGYRVSTQQRDVIAGGRTYPQARILIVRKSDLANRLGPLSLELIFSTRDYLPVTVNTSAAPPARADVSIKGSFAWQSSITPIPADKFVLAPRVASKSGGH